MTENEVVKKIKYICDNWYDENLEIDVKWIQALLELYQQEKEKNIDTIYANLEKVNEELMSNLLNGKPNKKPLSEKIKELEKENKKIQEELKQEKAKNKELEEKNFYLLAWVGKKYISKDKIKKLLQEIDTEYIKAENTFNSHFEKVNRDMQDYYIQKEATSIMQELSWIKGRIEELLEEE